LSDIVGMPSGGKFKTGARIVVIRSSFYFEWRISDPVGMISKYEFGIWASVIFTNKLGQMVNVWLSDDELDYAPSEVAWYS